MPKSPEYIKEFVKGWTQTLSKVCVREGVLPVVTIIASDLEGAVQVGAAWDQELVPTVEIIALLEHVLQTMRENQERLGG